MITQEQIQENIERGWAKIADSENHRITISGKIQTRVTRGGIVTGRWVDMKTYVERGGYEHGGYVLNGKKMHVKIHRLMAIYFIYNPNNHPMVNHKSGIKTENSISNLEWCTAKENSNHADNNGLRDVKGSKCKQSKLNEEKVILVKKMILEGFKEKKIADTFGVKRSAISKIKHGISWKHVA
ncbi:MAG: HNH endonuclease [Bacteriovoracaceae bacterium]